MSIIAALVFYMIIKGLCGEIRIANQKHIIKKLKEIEWKYTGGKFSGHYMNNFHPKWDEYCDEINPLRIQFGLEPCKKTDTMDEETKKKREDFIKWKKTCGHFC